ncbi:DoxX family protein [Paradesertivirga mongoliensis]|uniref:DoxX family protein n=1 Tax=Paradesertivirga mongoliensis TaxID=2100740 RepID=A0ABW4ZR24_9SPHI
MYRILRADDSKTTIIIRLMVGAVFLSEGIQKFLFPGDVGAGRFEKIGLPEPALLGGLVGSFEILCGTLILLGFLTRLASLPLIVIMITAISVTKLPIVADEGIWKMFHDSRTDWSMLLGSIFLIIKGGGSWSVDRMFSRKIAIQ